MNADDANDTAGPNGGPGCRAGCTCGCCRGVSVMTPLPTANRAGLASVASRVGTYGSFFSTMLARLSVPRADAPRGADDDPALEGLTVRTPDDPAIALLDAAAVVADVLSFYNERIVNEGYLRTAIHRRSLVELSRLVNYWPRPGVASSVYLAFSLDAPVVPPVIPGLPPAPPVPVPALPEEIVIPAGTLARSQPDQGEQAEPFETSADLVARAAWNQLNPRMTRPQNVELRLLGGLPIYLDGVNTGLSDGDVVLVDFGSPLATNGREHSLLHVTAVRPLQDRSVTVVQWVPWRHSLVSDGVLGMVPRRALSTLVRRLTDLPRFNLPQPEVGSDSATMVEAMGHLATGPVKELFGKWSDLAATAERQLAAAAEASPQQADWIEAVGAHARVIASVLETHAGAAGGVGGARAPKDVSSLLGGLARRPGRPPRGARDLSRSVGDLLGAAASGATTRLLSGVRPELGEHLQQAIARLPATPAWDTTLYAFRVRAPLFGHNAPKRAVVTRTRVTDGGHNEDIDRSAVSAYVEWTFAASTTTAGTAPTEQATVIHLNGSHTKIKPGSLVLIDRRPAKEDRGMEPPPLVRKAAAVNEESRAEYGVSGPATRIELTGSRFGQPRSEDHAKQWLAVEPVAAGQPPGAILDEFDVIRDTVVFAQSEPLPLADEAIDDDVCGDELELGGWYDGLEPGRWLIVSGDRAEADLGVAGVPARELVMLAGVEHRPEPLAPGDTPHTHLSFDPPLAYCYKRGTVVVHGNVVAATHGETREEVLGSADAARAFQAFALRQSPLTYVAAPNADGAESTLRLRVHDLLWHEADDLFGLGPTDRGYVARTDDDGRTTVTFGDGVHGARPPSGAENVRAVYRTGIGRGGNVKAGKVNVLGDRPLGVKDVVNPTRASGGADRESPDAIRRNAPLGVTALDRVVSVCDYEDFARTFAGVAKAAATRLSDGRRMLLHLTIAGQDDIPIDESSDLYRNLVLALSAAGDPGQPLEVAVRELVILVLSARVRVGPDYLWEKVEPEVRAALLRRFGFDARELGRPVRLSEVVSAMQAVEGVEHVDVDVFGGIAEHGPAGDAPATPESVARQVRGVVDPPDDQDPAAEVVTARTAWRGADGRPRPAQVACFAPAVPDTLILAEIRR